MTPRTGTVGPAPGSAAVSADEPEVALDDVLGEGAGQGHDSPTERELRRMVLLHRRAALAARRRAGVPTPRRGMLGP
ncbi:hypothetical protein GXB85_13025 [Cellulomonas sp. APG4]|uniref:hypothetical protein n=1 Tax=Cellulomonas sp. APG4 TaxID=1538656 RepID=UPI00137A6D23|nr:hypothetical protein [Cellulomonas sp. APG4]NCT91867.1 hypothetical protein [Cellulomonas sp. APG4]